METEATCLEWIRSIQGTKPSDERATAGRLLEEAVELALTTGMSVNEIYGHITDAVHNETLKASEAYDSARKYYPSQLKIEYGIEQFYKKALAKEVGDNMLMLIQIAACAGTTVADCLNLVMSVNRQDSFQVNPDGTFYRTKRLED